MGLPTAALLASRGHNVVGVDVNQEIVNRINDGKIHIVEPELDLLVKTAVESGRMKAAGEPVDADVYIICVPTPLARETHTSDLTYVKSAVASLLPVLKAGNLVLLESTCPPGTTEDVIGKAVTGAGFIIGESLFVAYCPERVLPGAVISELVTNERTVGGVTARCAERAAEFYRTFVQAEIHETTSRVAETVKLVENTSRDYQIAFANELAGVCGKIGVDVWEVIKLANRHPRVHVLQPGPGVGGHCIAVDPWFIIEAAPQEAKLIRAARQANDEVPLRVARQVAQLIAENNLSSVALLGMAYKSNIDDCRESPSLEVYKAVSELCPSIKLLACEPNVTTLAGVNLATLEECLEQTELLVILVSHSEFTRLDWKAISSEKYVLDVKGITR